MSHNITVEGGTSVRLPTAGKYCDRDIIITAEGGAEDLNDVLTEQEELIAELQEVLKGKAAGGGADPVIEPLEITENGTYTAPEGVDGYSPITVNVESSGAEEGTNVQWFADLITDSANTVEVYNDKFVGTLSAYAFYEKSNVTKIELPNLTHLKERCFFGCQNLKTLLLPSLIGYTYQYMAAGCTALVDVDIHGTNYVSSYTFQNCTRLKKVDLHIVGTIAANAFSGATKLETLIIRTDAVPTLGGTNAFNSTKIKSGGKGFIYVKSALLNDFKSATNWSSLSSQYRAIEDYPEITGG